jgi:hypothetical protein
MHEGVSQDFPEFSSHKKRCRKILLVTENLCMTSTGNIQLLSRGGKEQHVGETVRARLAQSVSDIPVQVSRPSINPTPHTYLKVILSVTCITWVAVTGVVGIHCRGLLKHMLANGALVYPSQGGRYYAEHCMAPGY